MNDFAVYTAEQIQRFAWHLCHSILACVNQACWGTRLSDRSFWHSTVPNEPVHPSRIAPFSWVAFRSTNAQYHVSSSLVRETGI